MNKSILKQLGMKFQFEKRAEKQMIIIRVEIEMSEANRDAELLRDDESETEIDEEPTLPEGFEAKITPEGRVYYVEWV